MGSGVEAQSIWPKGALQNHVTIHCSVVCMSCRHLHCIKLLKTTQFPQKQHCRYRQAYKIRRRIHWDRQQSVRLTDNELMLKVNEHKMWLGISAYKRQKLIQNKHFYESLCHTHKKKNNRKRKHAHLAENRSMLFTSSYSNITMKQLKTFFFIINQNWLKHLFFLNLFMSFICWDSQSYFVIVHWNVCCLSYSVNPFTEIAFFFHDVYEWVFWITCSAEQLAVMS